MAETSQFHLPLLASNQAQKNVTVNEALSVLDAVAQLRLVSSTLTQPPSTVSDGEAFYIPNGATGEWFGQDQTIAISANGGWRFIAPRAGWHAYNLETGSSQMFDGVSWLDSAMAATSSGSVTEYEIIELDHDLSAGATSSTSPILPSKAIVFGVSARVTEEISGSLTSWTIGVADDPSRYSQNVGISLNSDLVGVSGQPTVYYSDTSLLLTATGGEFASGQIRLAVHLMKLVPPRPV